MTKDGDTKVYGCSGNLTTSSTVTSILIHQVMWKENRPNKDAPVNHNQDSWQQWQESGHKEHETKNGTEQWYTVVKDISTPRIVLW